MQHHLSIHIPWNPRSRILVRPSLEELENRLAAGSFLSLDLGLAVAPSLLPTPDPLQAAIGELPALQWRSTEVTANTVVDAGRIAQAEASDAETQSIRLNLSRGSELGDSPVSPNLTSAYDSAILDSMTDSKKFRSPLAHSQPHLGHSFASHDTTAFTSPNGSVTSSGPNRMLQVPGYAISVCPTWIPFGSKEIRLNTNNNQGSTFPIGIQIADSGSGSYAVWSNINLNNFWHIYFTASTNSGATWATPVQADHGPPANNSATDPQVAASGNTAYVAWKDTRNQGSIFFNSTSTNGVSWLSTTDIQVGDSLHPLAGQFRLTSLGNKVHLAWEGPACNPTNCSGSAIYYAVSSDAGLTWSITTLESHPSTNPQFVGAPAIAALANYVYVAYEVTNGPKTDIVLKRSTDFGQTWSFSSTTLNTSTSKYYGVQLSANSTSYSGCPIPYGPGISAIWVDHSSGITYYNGSTDYGATWLSSQKQPFGNMYVSLPRIATFGNRVYVVAIGSPGGIYFSRTLDGSAIEFISTGVAPGMQVDSPRISAEGTQVYVIWQDYRNGSNAPDIYGNRSNDQGLSWLPSSRRLNVGVPPGQGSVGIYGPGDMQIAASPRGGLAIWTDSRFTAPRQDVFFNRL